MRITLEGESSQQVTVASGVPQGTVLGPILFLCHINDLLDAVKSSVRLFADDCLYREINSQNDHILDSKYQKTSNGVHTYRTSQRRSTQPEIYNIVQRNAGKMPTSH